MPRRRHPRSHPPPYRAQPPAEELRLAAVRRVDRDSQGVAVKMVHCDSNTVPGHKSTEHTDMLCGYISAFGFPYIAKPQVRPPASTAARTHTMRCVF